MDELSLSFSDRDFAAGEDGELLASDELDLVRLAVSPALSRVGRGLAPVFDALEVGEGTEGLPPMATFPGGSARLAGGGAGRPRGSRPGGPAGRLALRPSRPVLTDRLPPTDALPLVVLGELPLGGGGIFRSNTLEDGLPMTEWRLARSPGGRGVILSGNGPTRAAWKLWLFPSVGRDVVNDELRCTEDVEAWKLRDFRDVTLMNESLRTSRGGGANFIALALKLFELKWSEFNILFRLIGCELEIRETCSLPRDFTGLANACAGLGDTSLCGWGALLLRPLTLSSCVLEVLSESS